MYIVMYSVLQNPSEIPAKLDIDNLSERGGVYDKYSEASASNTKNTGDYGPIFINDFLDVRCFHRCIRNK